MDKAGLDKALKFIKKPQGELQIILYANIENITEPRKLDIKGEDLPELLKLFESSIDDSIIKKEDYTVIPLSSADERRNCFYRYDLEQLPDELQLLETTVGNDNLHDFYFTNDQFSDIKFLIIVIADAENEITLLKTLSPVEVIGRGGFMLWKSDHRLERFENQLLRISSSFQAIRVEGEIIITDLEAIEKRSGFRDVIIREATRSLNVIKNLNLVSNIETLEELVSDIRFARKLTKVARNSPVIKQKEKKKITNAEIIQFSQKHPLTRNKIRHNEDRTQFILDTRVSKDLFIKILNDDLLTSELTKFHYDSLAKDKVGTKKE